MNYNYKIHLRSSRAKDHSIFTIIIQELFVATVAMASPRDIGKQINLSTQGLRLRGCIYLKETKKKKKINLALCVSLYQSENTQHKGPIERGESGGIVSQRLVSPSQRLHLPSQIPPQHSAEVRRTAVGEEHG